MAKDSTRSSAKNQRNSFTHKGQPVHNEILRGLSRKECDAVFALLEFVELPIRTILNEAGGGNYILLFREYRSRFNS